MGLFAANFQLTELSRLPTAGCHSFNCTWFVLENCMGERTRHWV